MFDDQPGKQVPPPANLPSEPVDILAGVDKDMPPPGPVSSPPDALKAGLLKPKPVVNNMPNIGGTESAEGGTAPVYTMKEPILGKIILFFIFAAVLGGLGFGGFWMYAKIANQDAGAPQVTEQKTEEPAPSASENSANPENNIVIPGAESPSNVTADMNNDSILFGEPVDADKDGLDDVREREIGTDPNKSDTDGDGLSDGDEVIIWKTDPFNPDSDKDSFPDGTEVRNGYNPLGPGKLFSASSSSSSTISTGTR